MIAVTLAAVIAVTLITVSVVSAIVVAREDRRHWTSRPRHGGR